MVFVRDSDSRFAASLDTVWEFLSSGTLHSEAHGHRSSQRTRLSDRSGEYSWEQTFEGAPVRFTMRWTSYPPLGLAYDVTEGPFAGSRFFLLYEPHGATTLVEVVGEFVSPTVRPDELEAAVRRFFSLEFDQDSAALERWIAARGRSP